jgi:hypothetical protein
MIKLFLMICFAFLLQSCVTVPKTKKSNLPLCPKVKQSYKHNCFGSLTYIGGSKYIGEWKNNKRHGNGVYHSGELSNRQFSYMGEWQNNKRHGDGTMFYTWKKNQKQRHKDLNNFYNNRRSKGKWYKGEAVGEFIYTDFNGRASKHIIKKNDRSTNQYFVQ